MKIVIAMDSFKGSLSSLEAGRAVRDGILQAKPDAQILLRPLSDGGEGLTDALNEGLGGERICVTVSGPLGEAVNAHYAWIEESRTAVMEMAAAAGITLEKTKNPLRSTTRGVGEMILDALGRGAEDFIIGIGGSATSDGGIGMLQTLGWKMRREDGMDAGEGAQALSRIAAIVPPDQEMLSRYARCRFRIACDVTNPLCGPQGATCIYGPQKGVTKEMTAPLDEAMSHYADVTADALGHDLRDVPGAGAAGGLGFAFVSFLNAQLFPGAELVMDAVGLKETLSGADYLVTGEGRLDTQTAMGKAPLRAARAAKRCGARVIAFAGSAAPDAAVLNEAGIDAFFPILQAPCTTEEAMEPARARENLTTAAEQVFRLL